MKISISWFILAASKLFHSFVHCTTTYFCLQLWLVVVHRETRPGVSVGIAVQYLTRVWKGGSSALLRSLGRAEKANITCENTTFSQTFQSVCMHVIIICEPQGYYLWARAGCPLFGGGVTSCGSVTQQYIKPPVLHTENPLCPGLGH